MRTLAGLKAISVFEFFLFNQDLIDKICSFFTDLSSSNLSKFSNKTFIDLGNFEIPSNPFYSASLRLNIL